MTWRPSSPAPGEADPRPLAPSLARIAAGLGLAPPSLLTAVFARWGELVGPDVAAHAVPRSIRDGVLVVAVDHPAWATSLRLLGAELLARIRAETGRDDVQELAVRVVAARTRRPAAPG